MSRNQNLILTLLSRNRNAKPRVCDAVPLGRTLPASSISTFSPAQAAEVVSSNIVGYQRLSIPANGYALLANPFVEVGTGSTDPVGYAINGMFADDVDNSNAGNSGASGDVIQTWDTATQGYNTWFYSSRITGGAWADASTPRVAATDTFEFGDGYWYLNRGSEPFDITVSGEVSTKEVEVTLAANGYTLVCNPFPVDLPLNSENIDWSAAGSTAGNSGASGDVIQTWDTETQGYNTWFFSSRITGGAWADASTPRVPTTEAIPAGQGFWYLNRGSQDITITLKSPIAE